ncbi:hypothetical protein [Microvirga rosea]|uniref:hypothetical protein n=1 Tax=Microvirga rosea TaxID=2715425 RepID=UPI001D0A027F|nr:hypothetical protein [Microvirga rosea]MCB8819761.1 hypothetical protein [Microvirga rosea]
MRGNVMAWLKSGQYLPASLRDLHDRKDVFKGLDEGLFTVAFPLAGRRTPELQQLILVK